MQNNEIFRKSNVKQSIHDQNMLKYRTRSNISTISTICYKTCISSHFWAINKTLRDTIKSDNDVPCMFTSCLLKTISNIAFFLHVGKNCQFYKGAQMSLVVPTYPVCLKSKVYGRRQLHMADRQHRSIGLFILKFFLFIREERCILLMLASSEIPC